MIFRVGPWLVALAALLLLASAALAFVARDAILERWWIYQSRAGSDAAARQAVRRLAAIDSPRAALAMRVLQATGAAGIRNQVYLLFGLPSETAADREATLALVVEA